ncbi:transposase [Fusibacter sp. 3D3]|uniref:transposase n=1 Tax=Fusibacter sp. 3D3 TaxID=1048380 RepID=UPI0035B54255
MAISNHRILKVTDDHVTFRYKDNKDSGKTKQMTLTGTEFIRRFLMHVLPSGFVKIRHYGILAARNRPTKLAHCQRIMKIIPSKKSSDYTALEFLVKFMRLDFSRCSKCPLEPSNCDTVMQEATPHIGAG